MKKSRWDSLQINTNLINKYGIHFNFFLTKPANEIVYNHTYALSTIAFKDSVIYADNNQYLKRYYFLKNASNNDQIFDRINLLAQFYSTTVILKYQHPLMILTNTKSIFLKRLKRMKKMLVQQGSSDQSKSQSSKPISFNNCQSFLKSISLSELEHKSLDDSNHIQLDFSLFQDNQHEIHDTYAQNQQNQQIKDSIFFLNINKLAKDIDVQLILQKEESQDSLKHLITDFDDIDRADFMKKYQKILQKQNLNNYNTPNTTRRGSNLAKNSHMKSSNNQMNSPLIINDLIEKKPLTSSITITALEDLSSHRLLSSQQSLTSRNMQKVSMISPLRSGGISQQRMDTDKKMMKKSSFYQYELQPKRRLMTSQQPVINQDEFQDSPKNKQSILKLKFKRIDSIHTQDRNNPLSRQQQFAQRARLRNMQQLSNRQHLYGPKHQQYRHQGYPNTQKMKYSSIIGNQQPLSFKQKMYNRDKRQDIYRSAINDVQEGQYQYVKHQNYKTRYDNQNHKNFNNLNSPSNRMTSINININNLQENKQRVNLQVNKNNIAFNQQYIEEQKIFRAEKKKKIRQKAAALLNRVKSHEYLSSGTPSSNLYSEHQSRQHFGNNYYDRFYR